MKNKNIIIIIAVVAVLIIGLIAYKVLSTPKNNIIDNTNTEEIDEDEDYSDDYPEELIFLTDTNKEITLSGEKVKAKIVTTNNNNSYIYVNDKKVNYEYEYDNVQLYVTNDYAFVTWIGSQCNYYLINAIDKDGNLLEIEEKNIRQTFENIHYENDKLYADVYECATAGGKRYGKFELVREENTIKLK